MHMLSKKDLSSDEMDTLRRSRNPTTVVTANGEVQTHEEAQEYAPKFEDLSQEETEWQERCARAAAWKLVTSIWDTHGFSGNVFCKSNIVFFNTLSRRINPWVSNVSEHTSPHVMSEHQTSVDPSEGKCSNNYGADQQ